MFDLFEYKYSESVTKYIDILYPRRFTLHKGPSGETVPKWMAENKNNKCDVFSVDGDHSYTGARTDILNAVKATKKGGWIILDDMDPGGETRKAFDSVFAEGKLVDKKCVEDKFIKIGHEDRYDDKNSRTLSSSWCTARVT